MSAQYNSVPTDNILTWLLKIMRNNCLKSYLPQTLLGIAFKGKHKIPNNNILLLNFLHLDTFLNS